MRKFVLVMLMLILSGCSLVELKVETIVDIGDGTVDSYRKTENKQESSSLKLTGI